jgi:hypothetical protein
MRIEHFNHGEKAKANDLSDPIKTDEWTDSIERNLFLNRDVFRLSAAKGGRKDPVALAIEEWLD